MHPQTTRQAENAQAATDRGSSGGQPIRLRLASNLPAGRTDGDLREAWISLLAEFHWDLFGTLTFRDATHPESAFKRFRLFLSMLNRRLYGPRWYKHGRGIAYCVAMEMQQRGVLHFHCLLAEPELERVLKGAWFKSEGRWANELNELWNSLAGFARIEPIKRAELVQRYVSKYVVKGGEIELGGPLNQRRLEQAPAGSNANLGQRGARGLVKGSASVPGLPRNGECDGVKQLVDSGKDRNSTPCLEAGRAKQDGLDEVAQEHGVSGGVAISPERAPVSA